MKTDYLILSIETSLDDTCAAVTRDDCVLSNIVASQVEFHEEFGGTVPHIARVKHQEWIGATISESLKRASVSMDEVDAIAVTYGPGLAPSLEVGIQHAKVLAEQHDKPLLAVNHMEGHLLSSYAKNSRCKGVFTSKKPLYPALGFLISGGHTQLILMRSIGDYEILGRNA